MGFGALLIKNDQFIQLKDPFPFYVRTLSTLPYKRQPATVVVKIYKKLNNYYKKITGD